MPFDFHNDEDTGMATLRFYFDYVSPYSFLAQSQLKELQEKTQCEIELIPAFLGGLHQANDMKSPAFVPAKAKWIYRDCHLWAEHYDITLNWCQHFPFNSIFLLRATLYVQKVAPEKALDFMHDTFNAIWQDGLNVNDPQEVSEHIAKLGFEPEVILAGTADETIKQQLKSNGEIAVEKGLFGLPAFEVSDQVFFGQDRLHFVEKALLNNTQ